MKVLGLALLVHLLAACGDVTTSVEPTVSCEAQAIMLEYDNRDPDDDPIYEPEPCEATQ